MALIDFESKHLPLIHDGIEECTLFLSRNKAFPLSGPKKIALYGSGVRHTVKGGTGSGEVNSSYQVNIEEAFEKAGFEVLSKKWLDEYDKVRITAHNEFVKKVRNDAKKLKESIISYSIGIVMPEPEYSIPISRDTDTAIYVLSRISGEGNDRHAVNGDILLTKSEIRDIVLLNSIYPKFMLVLNVGGVVDLSPIKFVDNILLLSQLGNETGSVLVDIVLGNKNPTGKLAATWGSLNQYAPEAIVSFDDSYYKEGKYVGYRYFNSFNKTPLFAFGFGLSYSTFNYEFAGISLQNNDVLVKVNVKNVSKIPGKEVIQVYASNVNETNYLELVAFKKSKTLKKDETETLDISFNLDRLAKYDCEQKAYVIKKGYYQLKIGNSSIDNTLCAYIKVNSDLITKNAELLYEESINIDEINAPQIKEEISQSLPIIKIDSYQQIIEGEIVEDIIVPNEIKNLTNDELIDFCLGHYSKKGGLNTVVGDQGALVPGAAGETCHLLEKFNKKPLVMADGPAGLRITQKYYFDQKGKIHALTYNPILTDTLDFLHPLLEKIAKNIVFKEKSAPSGADVHISLASAFPIATALAQSWNLEYIERMGSLMGEQMEGFNVDVLLAPAMNLQRSIYCGRNYEYFSEDPLLTGLAAASIVKGVQSHQGKIATLKHFACNNQETNRFNSNSVVKEETLRDIYLKGFEICINEAHPKAIMSSYNLLNGVHTSEHKNLITSFLRKENKFNGFVMTDWLFRMGKDKVRKHPSSIDEQILKAGNSMVMPGSKKDFKMLKNALAKKKISRTDLEISATNFYYTVKEL